MQKVCTMETIQCIESDIEKQKPQKLQQTNAIYAQIYCFIFYAFAHACQAKQERKKKLDVSL